MQKKRNNTICLVVLDEPEILFDELDDELIILVLDFDDLKIYFDEDEVGDKHNQVILILRIYFDEDECEDNLVLKKLRLNKNQ
jgi:hypothetical protein